jgi:hypothetical protein
MDIIIKQATRFTDNYFRGGARYQEILEKAKEIVNDIDNPLDKIRFLNIILERNNIDYEKHKPKCGDPLRCNESFAYEKVSYDLKQELSRLGVQINSDAFTSEEKKQHDSKLDDILYNLEILKTGQQVIFEEINELRDLYFLGKKNWYQLLLGKSTEMVIAGIISETISKQIIESVKPCFPNLLSP